MSGVDKTIEKILATAAPVAAANPVRLLSGWLVVTILSILLFTIYLEPRADLMTQLSSPLYWLEIVVLSGLIISIAVVAIWLCFPDLRQTSWAFYLPVPFLLLYLGAVIYRLLYPETIALPLPDQGHGIECAICITVVAVIPALWMFRILRRHATVHPKMAGAVTLLTAASIGHLVLKIVEMNDSIGHMLFWHVGPILLLTAFGVFLGSKFLRW
jgi:hypothetical protein